MPDPSNDPVPLDVSPQPPVIPVAQLAPAPPARRWSGGVIIGWALIILVVGYFIIQEQTGWLRRQTSEVESAPSIQMWIGGRYYFAAAKLIAQMPDTGGVSPNARFQRAVDAQAVAPADRVAAAVLASALVSEAQSIRRLAALADANDMPDDAADDAWSFHEIIAGRPDSISGASRADLVKRYGWFARLALTHAMSPQDAQRRQVVADAQWVAIVLLVVIVAVGMMLIAGFILLILAAVFWFSGRLATRYRRPDAALICPSAYLQAFAVYLAAFIGFGVLAGYLARQTASGAWYALPLLSVLPVLWPVGRGQPWAQWRRAVGLHRGAGVGREMLAGVCGYLAGLPGLALAVLFIAVVSRVFHISLTPHPITRWVLAAGPLRLSGLYLLACIWAPIVEETFFRGVLQHHLRQRHGWWISAVIVSLIFASVHPQGLLALPALGMIALTFSAIREWRGSLIASMTAHALNNCMAVTVLVMVTR